MKRTTEREATGRAGFGWGLACALIFAAAALAGCGTGRLVPVDLASPGWSAQEGQAVWKPPGKRPELAGDLFVATNVNGDFLVQFTKTPFSIATGEFVSGRWYIKFGPHQYFGSGKGMPPAFFLWFELPRAQGGATLGRKWKFDRRPDGTWRLENAGSGESLEGRFFP